MLGAMLDPETLARLRGALASSDVALRAQSVDALAIVRDACGLRRALLSPDPYVRARAVQALAAGKRRLSWRLARMCGDAHPRVRAAVVAAASASSGWFAAPVLRRLARDRSAQVRCLAVHALGAQPDGRSYRTLQTIAAYDEDPTVREAADALVRRFDHAGRASGRGRIPFPRRKDPNNEGGDIK